MPKRRDYGSGSVYQRASDGRWVATMEAGVTANGARRRVVITAKTRAECVRKLNARRAELGKRKARVSDHRLTVKTWAAEWLDIKRTELRPKAYSAAASAINRWIVPTIGTRRLADLTAADIRAIAKAQRDAGRSTSNAQAAQRVLRTMLKAALTEGHPVPPEVLTTKLARPAVSDRQAIPAADVMALLHAIADEPNGLRWAIALLTGMRRGEVLGLTWDAVDFDRGVIHVAWQLQALPYNKVRRPDSGFRVPDGYKARRLIDAWHLTEVKSKAGHRTHGLPPGIMAALQEWRDRQEPNPWGLVWTRDGRPVNGKHDIDEWRRIQARAKVQHPDGRPYLVHEIRHTAAQRLNELGASPEVVKATLGHSSYAVSQGYMHTGVEQTRQAIAAIAEGYGLG